MGRFIVVVLDGFGIGYMDDVPLAHPADIGANTFLSITKSNPCLRLPALEEMGLMNAAGFEAEYMHCAENAIYGASNLSHFGADTFWGHQEIMGTLPVKPVGGPVKDHIDDIRLNLISEGYKVREYKGAKEKLLIVNEAVTVGDNVECDPGLAVNITGAIDDISFEDVTKIGEIVRGIVKVSRVIAFGGSKVHLDGLLSAVCEHGDYIGVNAPASGVYKENYHCIHLGYGVDSKAQLPSLLHESGIRCFLLGKAADIVFNPVPENSFSIVPTDEVFDKTIGIMKEHKHCFICANIQETDLAGHRQDALLYASILSAADKRIKNIKDTMEDEDILIVMADHGNDPLIGRPQHTREKVPVLISGKKLKPRYIGLRDTLSDTAQTAAQYFGLKACLNGKGFLYELYGGALIV